MSIFPNKYRQQIKSFLRKFLFFSGTVTFAFGLQWTWVEIVEHQQTDFYKNTVYYLWYGFLLHGIVLGLIALLIYDYIEDEKEQKNLQEGILDAKLDDVLISVIEKSLKKSFTDKEYREVLRIGTVLSRPLWLSGRYLSRIKIGKIVEEAAAMLSQKQEQSQALIDDLGWTNYVLGNIDLALKNITHGVSIAKQINSYYLSTKGLRHIGSIYLKQKDTLNAQKYYDEAIIESKKITIEKERKEMMAGIEFALGELAILQSDFANAEKHIEESQNIYLEIKDIERVIKAINLRANLHLEQKDTLKAKDLFREALKLSETHDRKDQIYYNLKGLSDIAFIEKDNDMALELSNRAKIVADTIGLKI